MQARGNSIFRGTLNLPSSVPGDDYASVGRRLAFVQFRPQMPHQYEQKNTLLAFRRLATLAPTFLRSAQFAQALKMGRKPILFADSPQEMIVGVMRITLGLNRRPRENISQVERNERILRSFPWQGAGHENQEWTWVKGQRLPRESLLHFTEISVSPMAPTRSHKKTRRRKRDALWHFA